MVDVARLGVVRCTLHLRPGDVAQISFILQSFELGLDAMHHLLNHATLAVVKHVHDKLVTWPVEAKGCTQCRLDNFRWFAVARNEDVARGVVAFVLVVVGDGTTTTIAVDDCFPEDVVLLHITLVANNRRPHLHEKGKAWEKHRKF